HEDLLEQVGVLEAAHVVFAEGGEVGDGLAEVIPDEPPVGHVGFDFLDGLAHGTNAEQVLDEDDLDEDDGIDAGTAVVFAVEVFDKVVNEIEIDGLVDFADEVVFGNQFFQGNQGNLGSAFEAGFAEQGGSLL